MRSEPLTTSRWATARWLVLAPHPDDETLGAGALIAHAAAARRLGGIVFLTDGAGSHPVDTPRIAAIRRAEARCALHRLGAGKIPMDWIGWRDAHPHAPDCASFRSDAVWLGAVLAHRRIDAIAVADRTESHCDHLAAYLLADAAIHRSHRAVSLFAYHVWSEAPARARRIETPAMAPGLRRHALLAHRSQMSALLGDGFRLPPEKRRVACRDILTLRKEAR